MNDPVNNPSHYADGCSVECIDMMQTALGWDGVIYFCLGNAYKYLWRHKLKNNPEEDLAKAKWYIDRAVTMAQDDPDSYGYLLSMAEPLMRLIETYTILYQSKEVLNSLDDSSFYPDSLETETFKFRSKKDTDDHKEFEKASEKYINGRDIFSDWFFGGLTGDNAKKVLNSIYGTGLFNTEETNNDCNCMAEDDWMFVNADAKIIHNRLNSKEARDGHVTGVDRSVVIGALDRILERCKKHLQKKD